MIKMYYVAKEKSLKEQLEEILKIHHHDELILQIIEHNSLEEEMDHYLYQISHRRYESKPSFTIEEMRTNYYLLENGDFIVAIDDDIYVP